MSIPSIGQKEKHYVEYPIIDMQSCILDMRGPG